MMKILSDGNVIEYLATVPIYTLIIIRAKSRRTVFDKLRLTTAIKSIHQLIESLQSEFGKCENSPLIT